MQAVILAGGKGTRLRPFTNVIPKPLVPLGEMPMLEIILRQLKSAGVNNIILAVNHMSELIRAFFGNGEKLGINISYSLEDKVLGTAGPIRLIDSLEDNFFVMNGDVLTTLSYRNLYNTHINQNNKATIATFKKEVKIDLGVLKMENGLFRDYIEKPTYYFDVSMGIYVLNKSVIDQIPINQKFDMPDLVLALQKNNQKIFCYTGDYEWLDIGRVEDYEEAVKLFDSKRSLYLPD